MRASLKRHRVDDAVDGAVFDLVAGRLRSTTTAAEIVADDGSDTVADTVTRIKRHQERPRFHYFRAIFGLEIARRDVV